MPAANSRRKGAVVLAGLTLAVLALYLFTLAPALNWADGARVQLDIMVGGSTYWFFEETAHILTDGLPFDRLGAAAWDHPLYVMLGRLFVVLPWGTPEFRLNLMSAIAGAIAVALVYRFGLFLTGISWAAVAGALALALSHTFWFHAVTTEVYTLNIAFMVGIIWSAVLWSETFSWRYLAVLALLAGLGLANHLMLGLTVLIVAIFVVLAVIIEERGGYSILSLKRIRLGWQKRSVWPLLMIMLLFVIGFAPWWIQFLRTIRFVGLPLSLQVAIGFPWLGHRMEFESLGSTFVNILSYGGWLLFQFSPVGVVLGIYGFVMMWLEKRAVAILLLGIFGSHVVFSANYALADQFNFHLPSYLAFALAIAWGAAGVIRRFDRWGTAAQRGGTVLLLAAMVILPVVMYAAVPRALAALSITDESVGIQPIGVGARNALEHFLMPSKRNDFTARDFAHSTLEQVAPDALIITPKSSDQETYVVLRYVQLVQQKRPDVYLELLLFEPGDEMAQNALNLIREQIRCRPIYLASLHPETMPVKALAQEYEVIPEANLYRVLPGDREQMASSCSELAGRWQHLTAEELLRSAMRWE